MFMDTPAVTLTHGDIRIISRAARIGQVLKKNPDNAMRPEFETELATLRASWQKLPAETRTAAAERVALFLDLEPGSVSDAVAALETT
jgi:hypothetical protein